MVSSKPLITSGWRTPRCPTLFPWEKTSAQRPGKKVESERRRKQERGRKKRKERDRDRVWDQTLTSIYKNKMWPCPTVKSLRHIHTHGKDFLLAFMSIINAHPLRHGCSSRAYGLAWPPAAAWLGPGGHGWPQSQEFCCSTPHTNACYSEHLHLRYTHIQFNTLYKKGWGVCHTSCLYKKLGPSTSGACLQWKCICLYEPHLTTKCLLVPWQCKIWVKEGMQSYLRN